MTELLAVNELHVHYGPIAALRGVSLTVNEGEVVAVIGPNGAGKTTLLRTISGLHRPSKGSIKFLGGEIAGKVPNKVVKLGLIQTPEGRAIFPRMTVLENLLMGAHCRNDGKAVKADVEEMCLRFPRLKERLRQLAGTLSGGEQQMLAIARSLMARPKLLVLDEPSLGLAPLVVREIFEAVRRMKDEHVTVLLVEQNARQALKISDRAYVLDLGAVVLSDSGRNLLDNEAVVSSYLGKGQVRSRPMPQLTQGG